MCTGRNVQFGRGQGRWGQHYAQCADEGSSLRAAPVCLGRARTAETNLTIQDSKESGRSQRPTTDEGGGKSLKAEARLFRCLDPRTRIVQTEFCKEIDGTLQSAANLPRPSCQPPRAKKAYEGRTPRTRALSKSASEPPTHTKR